MKALVFALLVAGPAYADAPSPPPAKAPVGATAKLDRPVAMVGNKVLWSGEVEERMLGKDKAERGKLIEEMIDDLLWFRRAEELSIIADDGDAKAALEEIKSNNNLDDAQLDKVLGEQGFTRARYIRELKRQIIILRTKSREITARYSTDRAGYEKQAAAWVAKQRKRVHIERWP